MIGLLAAAAWAAPLGAEDFVRSALAAHPDLVAAVAVREAEDGLRREASVFLANPEIQLGASAVGDLVFLQAQQPISLAREGAAARRLGATGVAVADARGARLALEIAAAARLAWARAVGAGRRAEAADAALALAGRFREAVVARAGAGDLSDLDAALAVAREAAVARDALDAHAEAAEAARALVPFDPAGRGVAGALADAAPPGRGGGGAPGDRADVRAAGLEVARAEAGLARARASALPLLAVGVQYQHDGHHVDLGPMATAELPLWARGQAAVASARGELDLARARLAVAEGLAAADVALADAAVARATEVWAPLAGADLRLADGLGMVEEAFRRGELDVRAAVVAQAELLDGRLAASAAEERLVGARIAALLAHEDPALLGP